MFGALIIGDEILSGKRQDKHFPKIVELLKARGLGLSWSMNLPDDPEIVTQVLTSTLARSDIVFSFGGIGISLSTGSFSMVTSTTSPIRFGELASILRLM